LNIEFIDNTEEGYVTELVILRENVDPQSLVVTFATDESFLHSEEDIAHDVVNRCK
jgi:hypothetical protein